MPNFSQIGEMKWPTKVRKLQTIEPKWNLLDDFFRELYCLKLLFHTYSGLLRQRSFIFRFVVIYLFFLIPSIPCFLQYPLKLCEGPFSYLVYAVDACLISFHFTMMIVP